MTSTCDTHGSKKNFPYPCQLDRVMWYLVHGLDLHFCQLIKQLGQTRQDRADYNRLTPDLNSFGQLAFSSRRVQGVRAIPMFSIHTRSWQHVSKETDGNPCLRHLLLGAGPMLRIDHNTKPGRRFALRRTLRIQDCGYTAATS